MLLRNATHVLIAATALSIPLAVLDGKTLLFFEGMYVGCAAQNDSSKGLEMVGDRGPPKDVF